MPLNMLTVLRASRRRFISILISTEPEHIESLTCLLFVSIECSSSNYLKTQTMRPHYTPRGVLGPTSLDSVEPAHTAWTTVPLSSSRENNPARRCCWETARKKGWGNACRKKQAYSGRGGIPSGYTKKDVSLIRQRLSNANRFLISCPYTTYTPNKAIEQLLRMR